ncbi:MAG: sugar-transfer associated ATP-grasp domain-containing protein [Candidatus Andersenbacteria bacterium]
MNARNLRFLRPYNRRRAVRVADDKLLTKQVLDQHSIPNQRLFAVITSSRDLKGFRWEKLPSSFVIKPNRGLAGGGIIVIRHKKKVPKGTELTYIASDRSEWTITQLEEHIRDILDGRFSLTNSPDLAFIEERIKLHPAFEEFTYRGIPDIRVVVFNGIPVMAAVRLPTAKSKGKANIALGAAYLGIDLATGAATNAVLKKPRRRFITHHPDTGADLLQLRVPYWDQILEIALKSSEASGLRYIGADIALDRDKGPVVMELNARPGLEIQLANLAPLGSRLERVEGIKVGDTQKAIRLAKDLFGGDIERLVEDLSHRHVLGIVESVELVSRSGQRTKTYAKVDTGAGFTSIDVELATKIGFTKVRSVIKEYKLNRVLTGREARELSKTARAKILKTYTEIVGTALVHSSHGSTFRLLVPITYYLAGVKVTTRATIVEREELDYPMIIGRRDLENFLIDPTLQRDVKPEPGRAPRASRPAKPLPPKSPTPAGGQG